MKFNATVKIFEDICANLSYLERLRKNPSHKDHERYKSLISRAVHFFVYPTSDGLVFAPSRFTGYKKNTITINKDDPGSGGETTDAISAVVGHYPEENQILELEYTKFCKNLDIKVHDKSERRIFWDLSKLDDSQIKKLKYVSKNKEKSLHEIDGERFSNLDEVRKLVEAGANIHERDYDGFSPFFLAIIYGYESVVKFFIDNGCEINSGTKGGYTPLHWSLYNDETETTRLLLDNGANVNAIDSFGRTPLHWAVDKGWNKTKIAKLLLDRKADSKIKDSDGYTPLLLAAYYGHKEIFEILVNNRANVDNLLDDGLHSLHLAASCSNLAASSSKVELVRYIVDQGVDVNIKTKDKDEATPMHFAAYYGHDEVVDVLVENEAEINSQDSTGYTPIFWAVFNDKSNIIPVLLRNGAKINGKDDAGLRPLHWAVIKSFPDVVVKLLKGGANINDKDDDGLTAAHLAIITNQGEIFSKLIKNEFKQVLQDRHKRNYLHWAARFGKDEISGRFNIFRNVLKFELDCDAKDKRGRTPLHEAATIGHVNKVSELIKTGFNINAQDKEGYTPLHEAVSFNRKRTKIIREGFEKSVKHLLESGADVNLKDRKGISPLHRATFYYSSVIELLVKAGADLTIRDNEGKTPLHWGAKYGYLDATKIFISEGSVINAVDKNGQTPLHLAAYSDNYRIVKELIKFRVIVNARDKNDITPLHLAAANGNSNSSSLLIKAGAKINVKDQNGSTPLHLLIKNFSNVVTNITYAGTDINAKYRIDYSSLSQNVDSGYLDGVHILVQEGVDVNSTDNNKNTPLHLLVICFAKIFLKLHNKGIDINTKDHYGFSPIYWEKEAIFSVVKILLKNGADINLKNTNGETPLEIAVKMKLDSLIELLKQ